MAVQGPAACSTYLDGRVEAARLEGVVDGVVGPALLRRRGPLGSLRAGSARGESYARAAVVHPRPRPPTAGHGQFRDWDGIAVAPRRERPPVGISHQRRDDLPGLGG
jgi:hypothetical protein